MCPGTGDCAAELFVGAESGNESDHSNSEPVGSGLSYACSRGDFDSAELRQRSTWTDSHRALYSGGRKQWRAVADVASASTIERCVDSAVSPRIFLLREALLVDRSREPLLW